MAAKTPLIKPSKLSKEPISDAEVPLKGAKAYVSLGKTTYSKCVLFLDDPLPKDGPNRFIVANISALRVKPKYFVHELSKEYRRDRLKVGMYSPDRDVRIFAKVQRCKYNCCLLMELIAADFFLRVAASSGGIPI